jgi:hypothetical protein
VSSGVYAFRPRPATRRAPPPPPRAQRNPRPRLRRAGRSYWVHRSSSAVRGQATQATERLRRRAGGARFCARGAGGRLSAVCRAAAAAPPLNPLRPVREPRLHHHGQRTQHAQLLRRAGDAGGQIRSMLRRTFRAQCGRRSALHSARIQHDTHGGPASGGSRILPKRLQPPRQRRHRVCIAEADVSAFDVRLRYALDPRLRRVLVSVHEAWRAADARWRLFLTDYLAERVAGLRLANAGCCREHVLTISNAYGQPGMPQQQQQQQLMMVQVPPGATAGTLVSVATPSGQQIQCTCVADAAATCIAPLHEISQSACFTQGARWRGARRDVSSSCPFAGSADHHWTSDRHWHSKTSLIAQRASRIEEWAALPVPCSYQPPSLRDMLYCAHTVLYTGHLLDSNTSNGRRPWPRGICRVWFRHNRTCWHLRPGKSY